MEFITGRQEKAVKVVVYGPEGIGKSTFASKFPTPVFLDTEGSTKYLEVSRFPKITSWTLLMEFIKSVKKQPDLPIDTLVLDTADWAEQLCISEICDKRKVSGIEDFGYGKGYTYLEEEFGRMLNLLEEIVELGINVVIVAHAQMRKFEQPDELGAYDRWELKLEKKTAALVKEWADMVLFANYKTYVVNVDNQGAVKGKNKAQGGKRVMYTTHHPCWDAKNRQGLADELPFEFEEIAACVAARSRSADAIEEAAQEKAAAVFDAPARRVDTPTAKHDPEAMAEQARQDQLTMEPGPQPEPPLTADEKLIMDNAPEPLDGIPRALADLMKANGVSPDEIRWAVAHAGRDGKGYYPESTPIANYDPQFVSGCLVGAWAQVFGMIQKNRKN